ncbi:MAG: hypothetical protein HY795_07480 [Desulfovibrio sp.]|nr:hypothetical protein [Desulfovibrio sp.]MBI4960835.1 hypothetical protein [Desulfovibrio sp.]
MTGITYYFDKIVRQSLALLGGDFLARWLNLAYALIGTIGFFALARRLGLSGLPTLVLCLVAQFNPKTYSVALSGHTDALFAYSLAPWLVVLADAAVFSHGLRRFLALGLGAGMLTALACSSTFGIVQSTPLLVAYALAAAWRRPGRIAALLGLIGMVVLVLQIHWVIPTAMGAADNGAIKYNQTVAEVQAEYVHKYREYSVPPRQAMIGHTNNLGMGTEYAYPVEEPKDSWWKPSAYFLLAVALLGLLCRVPHPALKWAAGLCLLFGFVMLTGSKTLPGAYLYEVLLARVKMVFFLMARPTRWLLIYYTGLAILVGLGLECVRRRNFWTGRSWPDIVASSLTLLAVTVYIWPWWSGQLTIPKNETTQTSALMLQPLDDEETQLATALAKDPGTYRITVFPTISSPTGNIPFPPSSSLTRNFGMMGKDSLVGPAFIGNPYGRFLLSLAHRRSISTDEYGRLLGLGAVRRVIWDKEQPYLSYLDFGWMPSTKRGSETLPDPQGILRPFLESQGDLVFDPAWSYGPFVTLENKDYLPRVRSVSMASLAAGGLPLLESLAQTENNPFANEAFFFSTDVSPSDIQRLGHAKAGLRILNNAWPELLLPFLAAERWHPALSPGQAVPEGWTRTSDAWHRTLWFEGSPLNALALQSQNQTTLRIPLTGTGQHRLFLRMASLPYQHGMTAALAGNNVASTTSGDQFDRGWHWIDLGLHSLSGEQPLTVTAQGRGAVVSGVLALPEYEFAAATQALYQAFAPSASSTITLAEAEACVEKAPGVYSLVRDIPLLARTPGVTLTTEHLRLEGLEGSGVGTLVAEGEQEGQALFCLDFPQPISGFALTSYPRLFGDTGGQAFVEAQWSKDGRDFLPLYNLHGATDGKWEDVYGRRQEVAVRDRLDSVWVRFRLRQAQLGSLGNAPNQPMTVSVTPARAYPGAPSMGQAVVLPARFTPSVFRPGPYQVRARMLTQDGPQWIDLGRREADEEHRIVLDIDGPAGAACDLFELSSLPERKPAHTLPVPNTQRLSPARYHSEGPFPAGGLLLFSEAYHPSWQARLAGNALSPLKAYGFMNAYPLPDMPPQALQLEFKPEQYRELGMTISLTGWTLFLLAMALLLLWPDGKTHRD